MENPLAGHLNAHGYLLLDGGLATALERRGHNLNDELWSARLLLDRPDEIGAVHREYLEAGADCITTASYQATVAGFMRQGATRSEALAALVRATELAVTAVESTVRGAGTLTTPPSLRPLVAASVGPYGAYLADGSEYDGRYGVPDGVLRAFHAERFHLLAGSGADLVACETIPNAREAEVLLGLLGESAGRWAWFTFSCPDATRIWDGTPIEEVASLCASNPRVAGVGINCTNPRFVGELVDRISGTIDLPVVVYPNSGEHYDPVSKSWSPGGRGIRGEAQSVDGGDAGFTWLDGIHAAWEAGARVLGGCCRIGPAEIAELRARLAGGDFSFY